MAVIAVHLSPKTFGEIMKLVSAGSYTGLEQFVEIAIFNQIAMEKGSSPAELMATYRRQNGVSGVLRSTKTLEPQAALTTCGKEPIGRQNRGSAAWSEAELIQALERMSLSHLISSSFPIADECPITTRGERIFGQVNRLFPMKLICRWVGAAAVAGEQWPKLSDATELLANDAALLGSALEKVDISKNRRRESMLATGLPRRGNLQSRDRFLSQFVARITRAGRIYPGALFHYGLACLQHEKLVLTQPGREIARIENPILDAPLESAALALSDSERSFFLRQVSTHSDAEWRDFKTVLSAIGHGSSTPNLLLKGVRSSFPVEWTEIAYRTHISGILARVCDLGLVTRNWDGKRVEYDLTDSASSVLAA
ncbi:MAG TPA: hypothetical protein VJY15_23060 [Candidatus Acidoferrum sp.]|nr:hypothetical protein [Candidatus Acidoferrum sp.]